MNILGGGVGEGYKGTCICSLTNPSSLDVGLFATVAETRFVYPTEVHDKSLSELVSCQAPAPTEQGSWHDTSTLTHRWVMVAVDATLSRHVTPALFELGSNKNIKRTVPTYPQH